MANARSGGPRRPELDYYEYKRLHEQHARFEAAPAVKSAPEKPAPAPGNVKPAPEAASKPMLEALSKPAPENVSRPVPAPEAAVKPAEMLDLPDEDDLDLPAEPLDLPEEKPSVFSGVKSLMRGVTRRVPSDEAEEREAPEHHGRHEKPQAEEDEDGDEDDEAEAAPGDGPQIDNPIGDALVKVKDLFLSARQKLADRRGTRPQLPEEEPEEPEEPAYSKAAGSGEAPEAGPVISRRMRKAVKAHEEPEQPPILDIPAMDEREVDELVSKPGTTVRVDFSENRTEPAPAPEPDDDDDDDDDDLPSARGTRIFGFFKKVRGRSTEPEAREGLEPEPEEEPSMDDNEPANLTERLAEEMEGAPALSRKARKALAAGKSVSVAPVAAAVPVAAAPAETPDAVVTPPAAASASAPYLVDEPTQQFRPLRARPARTPASVPVRLTEEDEEEEEAPPRKPQKPVKEKKRRFYDDEEPEEEEEEVRKPLKPAREKKRRLYDDEEPEDEDEEVARPVRGKRDRFYDDEEQEDEDDDFKRPVKPTREKKRRIYQDEDLEDEADYGGGGRYDDYDYDDYDDYDDYGEDDERFDDEYRVSGGRRFLGFLKGLVVFILFLAVCVLVLRQLEGSRLISLGGLRDAVGQVIPINLILPSPEPTATPMPTVEPTAAPTVAPTGAVTEAPDETPGADIAQVEPTDELDGGVVSGD